MGGNAFTSGPDALSTPRMPPSLYYSLRDQYLALLRTFYAHADTPIEAPSKTSYGDIDILVCDPKREKAPNPETLRQSLGAKRPFTISGSPTTSYAVPYPDSEGDYVQIDVHVCTEETYRWELFHQSHGDLWNLLGTTIRPFGLTANDTGLHLRIAEIEALDRKRSLLSLTGVPDEVITFLGLDVEVCHRPFGSEREMYEYVTESRFFRIETYRKDDLKANDRKRMAQRGGYRRFVEDWAPGNCRPQHEGGGKLTRDDVLEEALEKFGVREVYHTRLMQWRKDRAELAARQNRKESRKAESAESSSYADAWIRWLRPTGGGEDTEG